MQHGAGGTQTLAQETMNLAINGKAVKNAAELQAALDTLAPGAGVTIAYKSGGKDRIIEGVVK